MTNVNKELRRIVSDVEALSVQSLHGQPMDDNACQRHLLKTLAKIAELTCNYLGLVEVEAYNISWETDGEDVDLPKSAKVVMHREDVEDFLADRLSEEYGWLVSGLEWRIL